MAFEIERKFLVANDSWQQSVSRSERYTDGLVNSAQDGKVRVRVGEAKAWITLKGPRLGIRRAEYEYEIPYQDALQIQRTLCVGPLLEKTRHFVPFAGLEWEVDVYAGDLDGLVLAEIELDSEDQGVALPAWIGREVTGDARYKKTNLLAYHGQDRRISVGS